MFAFCRSLTGLNLSSFDTGQVKNMGMMFYSCYRLTELNLSNFDTSQVTNMSMMLGGMEITAEEAGLSQ